MEPNIGHHLVALVRRNLPGRRLADHRSRHEAGSHLEEGPRTRRRRRLAGRNHL